ncbi:MAG: (Fe-S)-binding protein [Desulfobacterium sp.]|nr:(Fe-S)-binding protein [Desulfobacterium sp.]
MSNIRKLAGQFKELEKKLAVCTRCGMCQAVCPLFAETKREADLARGKLALLDGLAQEMFKNPDGVSERLNRCLLCGSCQAGCSSGVNVIEIFLKARSILAEFKGLPGSQKLLFRSVLAKPKLFNTLSGFVAKFQPLFIRQMNQSLGTSCARMATPLLGNRHFVPLSTEPFHQKTPMLDTQPGKSGIRVGFFVGCLLDKVFPRAAEATIQVLRHHGVGIWMPENQGCCGIPALSSGDRTSFEQLVQYSINQFDAGHMDYLITSCATCTFTIKKIWPMMIQSDSREVTEKVNTLSAKTMDISQFLVKILGVSALSSKNKPSRKKITYHDPCHLKKSLGISVEPRMLIHADPDSSLVEMEDADRCCGMGGSFNLHHYDLSASIGYEKASRILDTGCEVAATSCPACMAQLSDALSRCKSTIQVKHVVEIYADSIME